MAKVVPLGYYEIGNIKDLTEAQVNTLAGIVSQNPEISPDIALTGATTSPDIIPMLTETQRVALEMGNKKLQEDIVKKNMTFGDKLGRATTAGLFAVAEFPIDVVTNVARYGIGATTGEYEDNKEYWDNISNIYWGGTEFGQYINNVGAFFNGDTEAIGTDFFMGEETKAVQAKWAAQRDLQGADEYIDADGNIVYEYGERPFLSASVAGQLLKLDPSSAEYRVVAGITDTAVVLVDLIGVIGIGKAAVKGIGKGAKSLQRKAISKDIAVSSEIALKTDIVEKAGKESVESVNELKALLRESAEFLNKDGKKPAQELIDDLDTGSRASIEGAVERLRGVLTVQQEATQKSLKQQLAKEKVQAEVAGNARLAKKIEEALDRLNKNELDGILSVAKKEKNATASRSNLEVEQQTLQQRIAYLTAVVKNPDKATVADDAIDTQRKIDEANQRLVTVNQNIEVLNRKVPTKRVKSYEEVKEEKARKVAEQEALINPASLDAEANRVVPRFQGRPTTARKVTINFPDRLTEILYNFANAKAGSKNYEAMMLFLTGTFPGKTIDELKNIGRQVRKWVDTEITDGTRIKQADEAKTLDVPSVVSITDELTIAQGTAKVADEAVAVVDEEAIKATLRAQEVTGESKTLEQLVEDLLKKGNITEFANAKTVRNYINNPAIPFRVLEKLATNDVVGKDALAAIAKRVADEAAKSAPAARATDAAATAGRVSDEAAILADEVDEVRQLADEAGLAIDETLDYVDELIKSDIDKLNNIKRARAVLTTKLELIRRQNKEKIQGIKEQIGLDDAGNVIKDYDNFDDFAKDYIGLDSSLTGEGAIAIERFLNFLTSGGARAIAEAILAINSADKTIAAGRLVKLLRKNFNVETISSLSKAETIEEVYGIMNRALSMADANQNLGRMSILRGMSRYYSKDGSFHTADTLLDKFSKLPGELGSVPFRVLAYGQERKDTLVPWSYGFDPNLPDDMVYALNDLFEFSAGNFGIGTGAIRAVKQALNIKTGLSPQEFRRIQEKYTSQMVLATTANQRRDIWYKAQNEIVTETGKHFGLDDTIKFTDPLDKTKEVTALGQFVNAHKASIAFQNGEIKRNAKLALSANYKMALDTYGKAMDDIPDEAIYLSQQLSTKVTMINPYELRLMLKKGQSVQQILEKEGATGVLKAGLRRIVSDFYDRAFKRAVLFRLGYVARNIMETQMRMYLNDHPSVFTDPLLLMSILFKNKNSSLGKMVDEAVDFSYAGEIDVTGRRLGEALPEDASLKEELAQRVFFGVRNQSSMIDPGFPMDPANAKKIGYEMTAVEDPNFIVAFRNFLYQNLTNEHFRVVTSAEVGRAIPKDITDWARSKKIDNLSLKEQVVEYYWAGPGSKTIDILRNAQNGKQSFLYESREAINEYLFGQNPKSVRSLAEALTDGYNPQLLDLILDGKVISKLSKKLEDGTEVLEDTVEFITRFDGDLKNVPFNKGTWSDAVTEIIKPIVKKWRETPGAKRLDALPDATYIQREKNVLRDAGEVVDRATNFVYDLSAKGERAFARVPEFGYAKWDFIAKVVATLSPEDAAKVVERAKESLLGKNSKWGNDLFKTIERNAKEASGSGFVTIDDINYSASKEAARKVMELFYDASKRNAFGHALRYISPFGQAWANSMVVWSRLAAQQSWQVYKVKQYYEGISNNPPEWLGDSLDSIFGDNEDHHAPILSTDPKTGAKLINIPAIGPLVNMVDPNVNFVMDFASMNMVFQNGLWPGFGPIVQAVASSLEGNNLYDKIVPVELRRAMIPYVKVEPGSTPNPFDVITPVWFKDVAAGSGFFGLYPERADRYITGAMVVLMTKTPEKYLNPDTGYLSDAGQTRLLDDARKMSRGLVFGRGLFQIISPGQSVIDFNIENATGEMIALSLVSSEFFNLRNQGYSQDEAMMEIIDKYGVNSFGILVSQNTFGIRPTTEAYEAITENPELLEQYGDILSYIYPRDGLSLELAKMVNPDGTKKTSQELLDSVNYALHTTNKSELNSKLIRGEITEQQYDEQLKKINFNYGIAAQGEISTNTRAQRIEEVRFAVSNSEQLAATPVGQAFAIYYNERQAALANGGISSSQYNNRQQLYDIGLQLVDRYPDFAVIWNQVLKYEVID